MSHRTGRRTSRAGHHPDTTRVLFDEPGPRGRRRILVLSVLAVVVLAALLGLAVYQAAAAGQLGYMKWRPFAGVSIVRFLLRGVGKTLLVTAVAATIAFPLGVGLGVLRLSPRRWLSWPTGLWIDTFRSVPLLLVIYLFLLALPAWGLNLSTFWKLTAPIVLCTSASIAEVFRAGVLALPRGQREAALAGGLTEGQAMRLVLAPQALRMMLPNLITQLISVLKDSTLGYVVSYEELMRQGQVLTQSMHLYLQTFTIIAVIYFLLNWLLSLLANRVDRALQAGSLGAAARGARRGGTAGAGDGAGTVGAMA